MTEIVVEREVLHQLARRARGDGDQRLEEKTGVAMHFKIAAAARAIVDATAIRSDRETVTLRVT